MTDAIVDLVVEEPALHCVGAARNAAQALELVRSHRPEVLVVDMEATDVSAAWLAREFIQHVPNARLVALSSCDSVTGVRRILDAGFHYHVSKRSGLAHLLTILLEDHAFLD